MSYESNIDINSQLFPVKAETLVVTDGNIPPKTRRINAVTTCKGRRITTDIPYPWARFIADAMTKYFDEQFKPKEGEGKVIASMVIPGDPKCKEDGRKIKVTETGRYLISRSDVYSKWISYARNRLNSLWVQKAVKLPVNNFISVKCTFYIKPKKNPIALADLCAGTIDCLYELGVLSDVSAHNVVSMDGSRIVPATENYRTEVIIREIKR